MITKLARTLCLLFLFDAIQASDASSPSGTKQRPAGFQLAPEWKLEGSKLDPQCKQVLQQTINCDDYVAQFGSREYRGSLEDLELTDKVCATTCNQALTTGQRRISDACAETPELSPGVPVSTLIDSIISGWEETCLRDEETGGYCHY